MFGLAEGEGGSCGRGMGEVEIRLWGAGGQVEGRKMPGFGDVR